MKRKFTLIFLMIFVLIFIGCAKKTTEEVIYPEEEMVVIEEEVTEELEIIEEPIEESELIIEEPIEMLSKGEYKVQLFATYDEMKANKVANDLRPNFSEEVYVEYIAPYYKVRVGHFETKSQAENVRNLAREKGYADAFIVLP